MYGGFFLRRLGAIATAHEAVLVYLYSTCGGNPLWESPGLTGYRQCSLLRLCVPLSPCLPASVSLMSAWRDFLQLTIYPH